jgi:hypothetical protein
MRAAIEERQMSETRDTLDELLSDPLIKLVMERDRVRPDELRMLLERAQRRADRKPFVPPAHVIAQARGQQGRCA